nr:MAG TPA: hypothetical protein [Caudoviricetes sp.]
MDYKTNIEFLDWLMWIRKLMKRSGWRQAKNQKKQCLKSSKKQGGKENERN